VESASPPRSAWLEPGRLLVGEHPAATEGAQERVAALLGAGISYFIDLTPPGECALYDHRLPTTRADDGRYLIYVRRAIGRGEVPATPDSMAETLDYVDRALEVGHRVYLHAGADPGRVVAVAACWLRRRGLASDAALVRARRAWVAACGAVGVDGANGEPESPAQRGLVESWREPDAVAEAAGEEIDLALLGRLRSRYHGGVIGLACGDALGASTQYRRPGSFAPITGFVGGGHWQLPPGAWTDDTAMSLCLAESLLSTDAFDEQEQRARYRRWQRQGECSSTGQCVGITAAVSASLQRSVPVEGGPEAMLRAGIVALYAASDPPRVFTGSAAAAAVTDASIPVRHAAMAYAALMLAALHGARRETLLATAREIWIEHAAAPPGILDVVLGGEARPAPATLQFPAGTDPFAPLRLATATLFGGGGFRDGLLAIVNRGGDADLAGALYGQLAGALWGIDAVPAAWRGAIRRAAALREVADRLLAAALAPRS
jgi:ADP-ribosylglycohydrolase